MPRKGTAAVKKTSKASRYSYVSYDNDDLSTDQELPDSSARTPRADRHAPEVAGPQKADLSTSDIENVDPANARELQNHSNEARQVQPRQASATVTAQQSAALAWSFFPNHQDSHSAANDKASDTPSPARRTTKVPPPKLQHPVNADNDTFTQVAHPPNMIQGGAHIPPNQQRNMRACMVCSIVRTQQQFTTQGCPNCEDVIELAGNPEQVNDCTSQVFEGLITVADTSRSWVARYQRLEGYVPGVYATQVEGILPEDVLSAVESAGINYVPRDGSEQEMLGKD